MRITDESIRSAMKVTERAPERVNFRLFTEFQAYRPRRSKLT